MSPEAAVMVLKAPAGRHDAAGPSRELIGEAIAVLAGVVNPHLDGVAPERYVDATDDAGNPACWPFVGYRPQAAELGKHSPSTLNAPDVAQYQGVVFADGSVAMRWLTERRSVSVWETFADMFDVHGHPEYGTVIHWPEGAPQDARDVIQAAADAHAERERQESLAADGDAMAELHPPQDWSAELPMDQMVPPPAVGQTWSVGSLGDMTEEQAAEILDSLPSGVAPVAPPSESGNTLVVCLDCTGVQLEDGTRPLIAPFPERADADTWLQVHRENNPEHQVVTVPGWPSPSIAVAIARAHILERKQ